MSKPRLFWRRDEEIQKNSPLEDPNSGQPPIPIPRAHFATREQVESTVSIGTGKKIQQILDEGNAIYLGVDPRDCGRIFRQGSGSPLAREASFGTSNGGEHGQRVFKKLLCGLSLDCAAKFVVVLGLYLGGHTLLSGLGAFLARKSIHEGFTLVVAVLQVIWGFYFGVSCLFGMSLMWGKCKRSPTAALSFVIIWMFTTVLALAVAALWLYFYRAARETHIQACRSQTVRASSVHDFDAPRRIPPKDLIDACVHAVVRRGAPLLVYGVVHLCMACLCVVVVAWARDYRGRLVELDEFERVQDEIGLGSEKVGLLIGTAPIGMRSKRTLSYWREESSGPSMSSVNDDIDPASLTLGDRRRQTIIRGSGVFPISARHSDLYRSLPVINSESTIVRVL